MYLPLTADSKAVTEDEFIRSAVIPLPERPPTNREELYAILTLQRSLNSKILDTQVALWLRRLRLTELETLSFWIPGPWAGPHPHGSEISGLPADLETAIATHPSLFTVMTDPRTAIEAGRRAGAGDWRAAIKRAAEITDSECRDRYLIGVRQAADTYDSIDLAVQIRNKVASLVPNLDQPSERRWPLWARLWPVEAIASSREMFPGKEAYLRGVSDYSDYYFSNPDQAAKFSALTGELRPPHSHAKILAARDPKVFLTWWKGQSDDVRESAIAEGIVPLLRRDAQSIDDVLRDASLFSNRTVGKIFEAWREYDPVAALDWLTRRPDYKTVCPFETWRFKGVEPAAAVALINRHPEIALNSADASTAADSLAECFDPLLHAPEAFAAQILRLKEPEVRRRALSFFGTKWGFHDGSAAFAWATNISDASERHVWLFNVLDNWIDEAPAEVKQIWAELTEFDPSEQELLERHLESSFARGERRFKIDEPIRFGWRGNQKPLALPAGGDATPNHIRTLGKHLASLAHPGEPSASNAALCLEVVALGNDTADELFKSFESNQPENAKEYSVRKQLLERWALASPENCARWIAQHGNGIDRELMPLALSRLALTDHETAFELAKWIPDELTYRATQTAILGMVATKSHQLAYDAGRRHGCAVWEIYRDWLRVDGNAANDWLKARWRDRH